VRTNDSLNKSGQLAVSPPTVQPNGLTTHFKGDICMRLISKKMVI
jgi:hypothetical protein